MSKELTSKSMISFNGRDGDYVPFDSITPEQKDMFQIEVAKRTSVVAAQMLLRIQTERSEKRRGDNQ